MPRTHAHTLLGTQPSLLPNLSFKYAILRRISGEPGTAFTICTEHVRATEAVPAMKVLALHTDSIIQILHLHRSGLGLCAACAACCTVDKDGDVSCISDEVKPAHKGTSIRSERRSQLKDAGAGVWQSVPISAFAAARACSFI